MMSYFFIRKEIFTVRGGQEVSKAYGRHVGKSTGFRFSLLYTDVKAAVTLFYANRPKMLVSIAVGVW